MKQISLTRGKAALVDDADFEWFNQWKWCYAPVGYAIRAEGKGKERKIIYMHRHIMDFPSAKVDHRDRNKLNNQRSNLRACTHSQNLVNSKIPTHNTSGYKGVGYCKRIDKWRAYLTDKNSRHLHIGYFNAAEDAATAYNIVAYQTHGEFAYMNKVAY